MSGYPHEEVAPVNCGGCHSAASERIASSVHGQLHPETGEVAATCGDCHTDHHILRPSNPESSVYRLTQFEVCASCHEDAEKMGRFGQENSETVSSYMNGVHGRGLLEKGLSVAPVCVGTARLELLEERDELAIVDLDRVHFKNPRTGEHLRSIPNAGGDTVESLAYDGELLWLLGADIIGVDPLSGEVMRTLINPARDKPFGGTGLAHSGPGTLTVASSTGAWFEVQTAATGFDAGLRTKEFRPDVIVLDYMLPDINGSGVIRSVRSDPAVSDVRIIIVSGVVNREDVQNLLECGADDFMQKPFSIEQLVKRITELVCE